MKKLLFVVIFSVMFVCSVFAIDISFTSPSYETNEGIVSLPSLKINLDDGIYSWFDLVLRNEDSIIFDQNLTKVKIDKINNFDVSLSDDNKRAIFSGNFTWDFKIKGLYIRTYEDEVNWYIGLDYKGDDNVDIYSHWIIMVEDEDNDDNLKPLPIRKLTYSLTGDFVMLNWIPSPDLDLVYSLIRLKRNGNFYKDIRISSKDNSYKVDLDLKDYKRKVAIYAKDQYYLSDPVIIDVVKEETPYCLKNLRLARNPETKECKAFYNTCDVPSTWEVVEDCNSTEDNIEDNNTNCLQVAQPAKNLLTWKCKIYSSSCDVPDGWTKVSTCKEIKLLNKKIYHYENKAFNVFQSKFDILINKKIAKFDIDKKNKIIEIRNSIMLVLKNYEIWIIKKDKTIKNLLNLIKEYKKKINS